MNPFPPIQPTIAIVDSSGKLTPQGQLIFANLRSVLNSVIAQSGTQAQLPANLQNVDAGYLYRVTDFSHFLQWTGAAWTWAPGELGSGYVVLFPNGAPNPITGWHLCDGSMQNQLNADGTITSVNVGTIANSYYRL